MNDKEYAAQKARIQTLSDKWIVPLGLKWWRVNLEFNRDVTGDHGNGRCAVAETMVDWHYLLATITFNIPAVAEQADDELETMFVHECCHILVNEMRMWAPKNIDADKNDEAMHHEERVASTLANAFIWTREAGARDVKSKRKK
jgi:hypothetical protein